MPRSSLFRSGRAGNDRAGNARPANDRQRALAGGRHRPSWAVAGSMAAGLVLAGGAGLVGAPVAGAAGTVGSRALSHDTTTRDTTPSVAPTFTSPANVELSAGTVQTVTITANGSPSPKITESGTLPPGMSFKGGTGTATISGTPAPTAAAYKVTLTATNGVSPAATQTLELRFGTDPAFTSPAGVHLSGGTYASVTVTATGSPTPTITETGTVPPGMTFNGGKGTATLTGTPHPSSSSYTLHLKAANLFGTATQDLTVNFGAAPAFTSPSTVHLVPNQYAKVTVRTSGNPAPTVKESGALPPGMSFQAGSDGTATISGVARPGSTTSFPVTLTATNSAGPAATQHLVLSFAPTVSFISPATMTVQVGKPNNLTIATQGTPVAQLHEQGALPPGLQFRANANGTASIVGVARPTSKASYPVTVIAANGQGPAAVQQLTLAVVQSVAITTPAQLNVKDGVPARFAIRATGTPAPAMSFQGNLPTGLHFYAGHGIAVIAGTPHFGVHGTFVLTVTAAGSAGKATQQLRIVVAPAPPPVAPGGKGYWYVTTTGQVIGKGQARPIAPRGPGRPNNVVGMAVTPNEGGYYLVTSYGGVFPYGDAPFYGSDARLHLRTPTVAIAVTPSGHGYYEVTRAGNVYTFGDAHFYGSTAGRRLPPIAAFAVTPDGHGYWLVTTKGNVYRFGDARFLGSPVHRRIPPVVAFAPTPNGRGYWVVTRGGNVFRFGDAGFYGSVAGRHVPPVTAFAPTKDGRGYWIVTTRGNVFDLGDARFLGSSVTVHLAGPVEGFAPQF